MARALAPLCRRSWVVPLAIDRGMPVEEAEAALRAAGLEPRVARLEPALEEARTWAQEEDGICCITGSVYLAGQVLQHLGAEALT
jgi:folylpolyglutamate synthase/dihydropteroate synthase